MNTDTLKSILESHALWLAGKGGERADLREANLIEADLSGADLSGADIRRADLRGADLRWDDLRRADLRGADLRWANLIEANLRWADLRGADLRWANLSGADLQESCGIDFAQCAWTGHGESGRQLLAVKIAGDVWFFCGCFSGTEAELRDYIQSGDDDYKASRTKAIEFLLSCF